MKTEISSLFSNSSRVVNLHREEYIFFQGMTILFDISLPSYNIPMPCKYVSPTEALISAFFLMRPFPLL